MFDQAALADTLCEHPVGLYHKLRSKVAQDKTIHIFGLAKIHSLKKFYTLCSEVLMVSMTSIKFNIDAFCHIGRLAADVDELRSRGLSAIPKGPWSPHSASEQSSALPSDKNP
jgi:hypothetical protein